MDQIIDADTHISEGEAMWAMMDKAMYPRRPLMLSVPEDTSFGNRNAFWLIDGEIYPKAAGKGSFALVTPSAQKVQEGRKDSTVPSREMTDIKARVADMDRLNTAADRLSDALSRLQHQGPRTGDRALSRLQPVSRAGMRSSAGANQMGRGAAAPIDEGRGRRNSLR